MKPPSSKQVVRRRLPGLAMGLAGILLLAACSEDDRGRRRIVTPTDPAIPTPTPAPAPGAGWAGSWAVDQVTPVGNCLADALNDPVYDRILSDWRFDMDFGRDGGSAHLRFYFGQGNGDSEGFWPLEFAGAAGPDGAILASVAATRLGLTRTDPWGELCDWEWKEQGGQLSATLSPDGRRLTGSIVETFHLTYLDATFTVHSHFTAEAR